MRPCSNLCANVAFMVTRISEDLISRVNGLMHVQNLSEKKRLCMMLVLLLMGHILNKIFKMKYETIEDKTHAYGTEFEIENVFTKWNKENRNSF